MLTRRVVVLYGNDVFAALLESLQEGNDDDNDDDENDDDDNDDDVSGSGWEGAAGSIGERSQAQQVAVSQGSHSSFARCLHTLESSAFFLLTYSAIPKNELFCHKRVI